MKQIGIDVDVNRAIENARQSFSESENDILRRLLLGQSRRPATPSRPARAAEEQVRARGLWSVEIKGQRYSAANMKEAYRSLLLKLDELSPNFIQRFSAERARSRRFVARDPAQLYDSSPHLAKEHARELKDGWYFDTNLSTEQVAARAKVAARIAGLSYGRDVKLLENLRMI
jgi:hypothetical protein